MRKALALVLVAAGGLLSACEPPPPPPPPPIPWPEHVRFCAYHHPGYDPRTNLFPDRYGRLRLCGGPRFLPPPPPPPFY